MSQTAVESARTAGVLRAKAGAAFLGIGESTFLRWVAEGRLPQGMRLTARCRVWRRSDLEAFLNRAAAAEGK